MSFFEIAYININMYIHRVVWIIYLDVAAAIPPVIGVKRGKEELQGGFSGRECVIKVGAALVTKLSGTYLWPADRRKSKQSTPTLSSSFARPPRLVLFARLSDTSDTRQEPSGTWPCSRPMLSLARLAVRIRWISSSSLKQFLARNCVFVRKLVAHWTELNLRDIFNA